MPQGMHQCTWCHAVAIVCDSIASDDFAAMTWCKRAQGWHASNKGKWHCPSHHTAVHEEITLGKHVTCNLQMHLAQRGDFAPRLQATSSQPQGNVPAPNFLTTWSPPPAPPGNAPDCQFLSDQAAPQAGLAPRLSNQNKINRTPTSSLGTIGRVSVQRDDLPPPPPQGNAPAPECRHQVPPPLGTKQWTRLWRLGAVLSTCHSQQSILIGSTICSAVNCMVCLQPIQIMIM